jgi:hypothetical protein
MKRHARAWIILPHMYAYTFSSKESLTLNSAFNVSTFSSTYYPWYISYGWKRQNDRQKNQGGEHSVEKISENSIGILKNLWKHKHPEEKPA